MIKLFILLDFLQGLGYFDFGFRISDFGFRISDFGFRDFWTFEPVTWNL